MVRVFARTWLYQFEVSQGTVSAAVVETVRPVPDCVPCQGMTAALARISVSRLLARTQRVFRGITRRKYFGTLSELLAFSYAMLQLPSSDPDALACGFCFTFSGFEVSLPCSDGNARTTIPLPLSISADDTAMTILQIVIVQRVCQCRSMFVRQHCTLPHNHAK